MVPLNTLPSTAEPAMLSPQLHTRDLQLRQVRQLDQGHTASTDRDDTQKEFTDFTFISGTEF